MLKSKLYLRLTLALPLLVQSTAWAQEFEQCSIRNFNAVDATLSGTFRFKNQNGRYLLSSRDLKNSYLFNRGRDLMNFGLTSELLRALRGRVMELPAVVRIQGQSWSGKVHDWTLQTAPLQLDMYFNPDDNQPLIPLQELSAASLTMEIPDSVLKVPALGTKAAADSFLFDSLTRLDALTANLDADGLRLIAEGQQKIQALASRTFKTPSLFEQAIRDAYDKTLLSLAGPLSASLDSQQWLDFWQRYGLPETRSVQQRFKPGTLADLRFLLQNTVFHKKDGLGLMVSSTFVRESLRELWEDSFQFPMIRQELRTGAEAQMVEANPDDTVGEEIGSIKLTPGFRLPALQFGANVSAARAQGIQATLLRVMQAYKDSIKPLPILFQDVQGAPVKTAQAANMLNQESYIITKTHMLIAGPGDKGMVWQERKPVNKNQLAVIFQRPDQTFTILNNPLDVDSQAFADYLANKGWSDLANRDPIAFVQTQPDELGEPDANEGELPNLIHHRSQAGVLVMTRAGIFLYDKSTLKYQKIISMKYFYDLEQETFNQ